MKLINLFEAYSVVDTNKNTYNFVNSHVFTHETSKENAESILRHGFRRERNGTYFSIGDKSYTKNQYGNTTLYVNINIPDNQILDFKDIPSYANKSHQQLISYAKMHGYKAWKDDLQIIVFNPHNIRIINIQPNNQEILPQG